MKAVKKSYNEKVRKLVTLGVMIALIIVLQSLSTVISRAAILPFNITLTLIPIIIGALTYGVSGGAILGLSFGVITMIFGLTGFDPSCSVLLEKNIFYFILICLVKGTAAGAAAGLVGRLMKKDGIAEVFVAAAVTPIVNTGLFLMGMRLCFYDLLVDWSSSAGNSILYYMIFGLCGINFLIELGTNLVLAPAVNSILRIIQKRPRGYRQ